MMNSREFIEGVEHNPKTEIDGVYVVEIHPDDYDRLVKLAKIATYAPCDYYFKSGEPLELPEGIDVITVVQTPLDRAID